MHRFGKLIFAALIAAAVCTAMLSGCGKQVGTTSKTAKGTKENPWVIGMSQCTIKEPWRVQMDADIADAAKKHPELKVEIKDADDNAGTQQDQVREFITQGVDLIIISPKESTPLTGPVAEAFSKGIPVIVLDRKVNGDAYTTFIGGNNLQIGREAGKFMVKLLGGKGNIVELKGNMSSSPGQDRHNGFMDGIKGSQIKVVFSADCDWKQEKAQSEMNSALSVHKDIVAVYAHNDPSANGAYNAAKNEGKGREKALKFVGIDGLPTEGQQYVRTGKLTATFEYPTCGPQAIDTALKILNGEKVPKDITLGTKLYTKDNVDKGGQQL